MCCRRRGAPPCCVKAKASQPSLNPTNPGSDSLQRGGHGMPATQRLIMAKSSRCCGQLSQCLASALHSLSLVALMGLARALMLPARGSDGVLPTPVRPRRTRSHPSPLAARTTGGKELAVDRQRRIGGATLCAADLPRGCPFPRATYGQKQALTT